MHQVPLAEYCRRLGTDSEQGLSGSDAAERLARDGPNALRQRRSVPEFVKFLRQLTNLFALLLVAGAGLSFIAEGVIPGQGNLPVGLALLGVVLLNGVFSYFQQRKAERIMAGFRDMLPAMATVVRDGIAARVSAASLVRGDLILLEEGDLVPADARLVAVVGLKVNNSSLTGESEPQLRTVTATAGRILESRNLVFSGTMVEAGSGRGIVYATGMKTQIGRTADLTQTVTVQDIPIRREITRFTRIITLIAIIMGVTVFLASSIRFANPFWSTLIFIIGIIVANVPEGLLPTVTLCLSIAARRMAGQNALVKNLESVETLGCTTVICTDKTGTLTLNRLSVTRLFLNECIHAEADANFEREELDKLLMVATLCNNAHLSTDGNHSLGDPTEGALLLFARRFLQVTDYQARHRRLFEEPFTARSKLMVTVNECDGGQVVCLKGAPDVVINRCSHILINGIRQPLTAEHRQAYLAAYGEFAHRAERVLLLAWQDVVPQVSWGEADLPLIGYTFIGLISMLDPPRPEVAGAVAALRAAGIKVFMVTGDYQVTAEAIGRMVGIITGPDPVIISGDQLRTMGDAALDWELGEEEVIFARISPDQKLSIVQALQHRGEIVAVTGDGVNDAPALRQADIGVAMGCSGTDVAREAADMVLLDDNFATLVPAVKEGRTIFDNLKKSIAYTVTHAVPEVAPYVAFLLLGIPLPLTVMLILAIDLCTDMLPAVALGSEPPEQDIMRLLPRPPTERLVPPRLLFLAYGVHGVIEAGAAFYAYLTVLHAGGWHLGMVLPADDPLTRKAVTAFFAAIIVCQAVNALAARTHRQSLFQQGIFSNRPLLVGVAVSIGVAAAVVWLVPLNSLFCTVALSFREFTLAWPFAVVLLLVSELRRFFIRKNVSWARCLNAS